MQNLPGKICLLHSVMINSWRKEAKAMSEYMTGELCRRRFPSASE